MDQEKYTQIMSGIASGKTPTKACLEVLSTIVHLMHWLSSQPGGKILHAAMLQAEGDARIEKSDQLHVAMIERINNDLVRSPAIAAVEQAEINRMRKEGFMLRARAEKMLPKKDMPNSKTGSWIDKMTKSELEALPLEQPYSSEI